MAVIYVDGINGDDVNSGLVGFPKKTISGANAVLTGSQDLVIIEPGVYPEPDFTSNSSNGSTSLFMKNPAAPGLVIVDFENRAGTLACENGLCNWRINYALKFLNIHFRNPFANDAHSLVGGEGGARFYHCVFYQRDGAANTGRGMSGINSTGDNMWAYNCSFYNLGIGVYSLSRNNMRNNYFNSVASPFTAAAGTGDHNAYPGNTEVNGIDTNVTDPGFVDAANEDFRLDPVTVPANYVTFMSAGRDEDRIGAFGYGGLYYRYDTPPLKFLSADPTPAAGNPQLSWENEGPAGTGTYTDPGVTGDVIEDPGTGELILDLATTPAATGGRVRSDVFDTGALGTNRLESIAVGRFDDLPGGAAVDLDTTLPQQIEYRSSGTSFLKGDVSPSWVAISPGTHLNQAHRYHQIRIVLRTDHTNA
jgi:hypothetical protein